MTFPDANYIVWRRGLRGPTASLDHLDPRSMEGKHTLVAVKNLTDDDRRQSFAEIVRRYPCPEYET